VRAAAKRRNAQGGTSACRTGAALSFVSFIPLFGRPAIPAVQSPSPFEATQRSWCPEYPHLEDLEVAARSAPNRNGVERRCFGTATAPDAWQRHETTVCPGETHPDDQSHANEDERKHAKLNTKHVHGHKRASDQNCGANEWPCQEADPVDPADCSPQNRSHSLVLTRLHPSAPNLRPESAEHRG
jgi:hypothetical protein